MKIEQMVKDDPTIVRLPVFDSHDTEISVIVKHEPNTTSKDKLGTIVFK